MCENLAKHCIKIQPNAASKHSQTLHQNTAKRCIKTQPNAASKHGQTLQKSLEDLVLSIKHSTFAETKTGHWHEGIQEKNSG